MSIIIGLGGNSTEKNMIDLIANMKDGQCHHSTTIRTDLWEMERRGVEVINLGCFHAAPPRFTSTFSRQVLSRLVL
jgi:hypothetical protein